ncbi:hypothetical protein LCGC14_2262700 [marine sediment metagenome]|uniref:Uncharacterized protein n=1 Tax=marine sediment metagenome TaxID=412755 RepID=A0A0F9FBL5_9ZZZZ
MAWWEEIGLGIKVERAADALAIDASPGEPFFTVTGLIRLTGLLGYCTVAVGGANTCQFTLDPDAAGAAVTVLDANLDITASTEGDIISIAGDPGTNLMAGHVCVQQMLPVAPRGVILEAGVIGFIATAALGTFRWVLYYKPVDDGATVTVI